MKTLPCCLLLASLLTACGDDGGGDAGVDGPPDPCAPKMTFTGEYVSWDSGASFMGINAAVFALRSDPSVMDTTAPNGRFDMCITPEDGFVDITPAATSDVIPGTVIVSKDTFKFLPIQSYRSFSPTRAAEYGYDASLAQLYVHVNAGSRTVSSSAASTVQKSFDGTAWQDGSTGTDLYFGNIAATSTKITATGGGIVGGGTVPLTAGHFTYVTLIAK